MAASVSKPPKLIIELRLATAMQVRYACLRYHYAKTVPSAQVAFSCYENGNFVGVIVFGNGANNHLASSFGLLQGQVFELVRVALNQKAHQAPTSQYIGISLRLLRKTQPQAKLIISYADMAQGHTGKIYQATNWLYLGAISSERTKDPKTGLLIHNKSIYSKYGHNRGFERVQMPPKHKYAYPLTKDMRLKLLSEAIDFQSIEAGASPDPTAPKSSSPPLP